METNGRNASLERRRFARLPETNTLIDRIRSAEVGDVIPTAEVERILARHGLDAITLARSACITCEKEGIACRYAPSIYGGLKLLTPSEACDRASLTVRKINRCSKRELNRLVFIPFDKLSRDEKLQHLTASSALGALSMFSSKRAATMITNRVAEKPLDIGETLQLFEKRVETQK